MFIGVIKIHTKSWFKNWTYQYLLGGHLEREHCWPLLLWWHCYRVTILQNVRRSSHSLIKTCSTFYLKGYHFPTRWCSLHWSLDVCRLLDEEFPEWIWSWVYSYMACTLLWSHSLWLSILRIANDDVYS